MRGRAERKATIMSENQKRDLVLPPGSYAYMQDVTKGVVKTYTRPDGDQPDRAGAAGRVRRGVRTCSRRARSRRRCSRSRSPPRATTSSCATRREGRASRRGQRASERRSSSIGRKINITGPCAFALWPGQMVELVAGPPPALEPVPARPRLQRGRGAQELGQGGRQAGRRRRRARSRSSRAPPDLTVGKQLIIKGTEVSFYIPPTGVEVVRDEQEQLRARGAHARAPRVRILVDQNGKKRYERGPQVVFPRADRARSSSRATTAAGRQEFRAVELNEIQGLHIKVIAPYTEDGARAPRRRRAVHHRQGDRDLLPARGALARSRYDGRTKHFAIAVPAGEARYVMNRKTGAIRMVRGPAMLLPNPRRRGDRAPRAVGSRVRDVVPGQRRGARLQPGPALARPQRADDAAGRAVGGRRRARRQARRRSRPPDAAMEASRVSGDQALVADEFSRASTYTQPRTITLDNEVPGRAADHGVDRLRRARDDKTGRRRVEHGPTHRAARLRRDLEVAAAVDRHAEDDRQADRDAVPARRSTTRSATSCIVETLDHVARRALRCRMRVDFEGDPLRWFAVENYVKLLCDHVRSVLKGQRAQARDRGLLRAARPIGSATSILGNRRRDGARAGHGVPGERHADRRRRRAQGRARATTRSARCSSRRSTTSCARTSICRT